MTFGLAHWLAAPAIYVGLLTMPSAVSVDRFGPVYPLDAVCHVQSETDATGVFHGVGVVTEIQPGAGALTLDHEDIVGLMPAMVMMYRVKSPEVSSGLKVGDRIAFDLDAKSYTILSAKVISSGQ